MSDQPTILVKKPDGTFVRVPLSDLGKKSTASTPAAPAVAAAEPAAHAPTHHAAHAPHATAKPHHTLHHGAAHHAQPAGSAPASAAPSEAKPKSHFPAARRASVHVPELDEMPAAPRPHSDLKKEPHHFAHEDIISLLEERAPDIDALVPATSDGRASQVDEVLRSLPFRVPAEQASRMRTIVQLFLKDVRSADQTREVLLRPLSEGGIGLTKNQTEAVIGMSEEINGRLVSTNNVPTIKSPTAPAPRVATPPKAATPTPIRLAEHQPLVKTQNAPAAPVRRATEVVDMNSETEHFTLQQKPIARQVMHDVTTRPTTMGPVDEIRYLTTQDFRRLSPSAEESARRVHQKFDNLKAESILLFLQAVDAWRQSPVYHEYINTVATALSSNQKLPLVNQSKELLQWPEIQSIIKMEIEMMV